MAALEKYFEIEDKLTAAIQSLNPSEQDIIIRCYMDGKLNWRVAADVGYDVRHMIRKKILLYAISRQKFNGKNVTPCHYFVCYNG